MTGILSPVIPRPVPQRFLPQFYSFLVSSFQPSALSLQLTRTASKQEESSKLMNEDWSTEELRD